jgi:hypothetical protein
MRRSDFVPLLPQAHVFENLLIGLQDARLTAAANWLDQSLLRRALNALAVALPTPAPLTARGWQSLLNRSVGTWWPGQLPIPTAFDGRFGLLEEEQLSEEASHYYYQVLVEEAGLPETQRQTVARVIDNLAFKHLIVKLREKARQPLDASLAQQEYMQLRRFVIEHPFTTGAALLTAFRDAHFLGVAEVGALYEPAGAGPHWHCQHCGPLQLGAGQLRGIRPRLCADHLPGSPAVLNGPTGSDVRRLRTGLHWRTCFPGKPELALYEALMALQRQYPHRLAPVELWPGLDQYDLRLHFLADDSHWAVDVKDQQDPRRLGQSLTALAGHGGLDYARGFYVVPDRWLTSFGEEYLRTLREYADLPANHHISSLSSFLASVAQKIQQPTRKTRRK